MTRVALRNRLERDADRGRMMREVVDDGDAARRTDDLLPPLHTAKGFEPTCEFVLAQSEFTQQQPYAERVGDVHAPADRQFQIARNPRSAIAPLDRKACTRRANIDIGRA